MIGQRISNADEEEVLEEYARLEGQFVSHAFVLKCPRYSHFRLSNSQRRQYRSSHPRQICSCKKMKKVKSKSGKSASKSCPDGKQRSQLERCPKKGHCKTCGLLLFGSRTAFLEDDIPQVMHCDCGLLAPLFLGAWSTSINCSFQLLSGS